MHISTITKASLTLNPRYFGQAVLDSIHRSIGIEQWHALVDPTRPDPALDKVLGAFDMFVLNGGPGDIDDVSLSRPRPVCEYCKCCKC